LNTESEADPHDSLGPNISFAQRISEHLPLAAIIANLSLWQSYISNAEADVIGSIASSLYKEVFVVE
jgi:hypothetical protein